MTPYRTERRDALHSALPAKSAEECAQLLGGTFEELSHLREPLAEALRGSWSSVVVLVSAWRTLVEDLLAAAADSFPESVTRVDDHFGIMTSARIASVEPVSYLDHHIVDVPFSPLLEMFGADRGIGVVAIECLRALLPGQPPLYAHASSGWPTLPEGSDPERYRRLADLALRGMEPPLIRVREMFALSNIELAGLFGVTRQAADQWMQTGEVPAARLQKLANLVAVGELLHRKLRPGQVPLVVRRQVDAYGGLNLLEMVRADRDAELLELTERSLDWSVTA